MRFLFYALFGFLFSACSSLNQPRPWAVNYYIEVLSGVGTYTVTYMRESGATTQVGGLTEEWVSPTLNDYDEGARASITVERTSGDCVLEVNILRNAAVHESAVLERADKRLEVTDVI